MKELLIVAACMFVGFVLVTAGVLADDWSSAILYSVVGLIILQLGSVIALRADARRLKSE